MKLIAYADGSCIPNPGRGSFGVVVQRADGSVACRIRKTLDDEVTCNIAEWRGALAALDYLLSQQQCAEMELRMDSTLVVNQLDGKWKVRNRKLQPLASKGRAMLQKLRARGATVKVRWVPREQNAEADAYAEKD